jgi:hypothetical protein
MTVPTLKEKDFESEIGRELFRKLKAIYDEEHFLFCVMSRLIGDTKKAKLLEIINNGVTDDEKLTLYSLAIERDMI